MYRGACRGGEDTLVGEVCKMCGETRPPAHRHSWGWPPARRWGVCLEPPPLDNGDPVVANVARWKVVTWLGKIKKITIFFSDCICRELAATFPRDNTARETIRTISNKAPHDNFTSSRNYRVYLCREIIACIFVAKLSRASLSRKCLEIPPLEKI